MITRNILTFLLTALAISSCAVRESETLKLTSSLPEGIVASNAVLEFEFSHAVVPSESTTTWTSTPYIEFVPAVEGQFVWQDTSRLIFSPDAPLPGDRRYTGTFNVDLLLKSAGAKAFEGDEEFSFATEPFRLKTAEFFLDRIDSGRTVGIKANLEFTYAVGPEDAAKYLKLSIDDKPHRAFTVMVSFASKVIPLEIATITQLERGRKITVAFDDALTSPETNTKITMKKPVEYQVPGLEELRIYGHEFGFDGNESWIKIRTSQEVDWETAQSFIELTPAREFRIDPGDGLGFTLRGRFEPGIQFQLVVKKGLQSLLGAKTQNEYRADITVGNVKPSFRFASPSGVYMLLGGAKSIEIKTINLSKLNVRISQIFHNNLVFFLDGGRRYDYDYYYDEELGRSTYRRKYRFYMGNYGRMLDKQTLEIASIPNQEVTTVFDLTPFLRTDFKGFYLVEIADRAESWRSTSKLISISDIGLIVKRSVQELNVFAVSLETNEPLSGVQVNLISTNNQTMVSRRTDAEGLARLSEYGELKKNFSVKLITAEHGDDFNFINLNDYRVETSRFDVSGKRDPQGFYDAFLYGDRNLYRPGEKIYISGIIRSLDSESNANMPVRIKIYNPRGTMVSELQRTLNEEGSFETSYETLHTSPTGEYRFDLFTGDDLFLTSYKVSVEDFVPDRLKVHLEPSMDSAKPGDKIKYALQAFNFFGPPAAGRNWEFEGTFSVVRYISKRYPAFRFFDDDAVDYSADPYILNGKTDSEGKAAIEFPIPRGVTSTGLLRARARVAVFDESGRPVYQTVQTTIYPKDYYIGVLNKGAYYASPRTPQKIQIVAVDLNDNTIKGFKVKVDLVRREWHSVLRRHTGSNTLRYVSEKREILVQTRELTLDDGPTEYTYSVPRSGDYRLRVSKVDDRGYNELAFYAYSWGTTDITSFQVDPEARVDIVLDKPVYAPGDKASVLFQCPFGGKMLVTVERNKVFSYRYLDVENNSASMEIDVLEEFLPNVYVTVVLFRKVKELNIPLMAGHGFVPIPVEKKSNKLDVVINAPERIRPKRKQNVTVSVAGEKNVFVTLAAVDEGICQVKNYKTPDPYGYFYAKKALEVDTYDFFRDLIPEVEKDEKTESSPGGGMDEEIALRVSPLGVKRFKPVALWSGILKTNSKGEADVTLDIPEFSGELRLMAVAYKGDRFGATQRGMKVSDPVVITAALPRFLSPGDAVTMSITAFNTTESAASLKFRIETEGSITAIESSASLELDANQERVVSVPLRATDQIGKATVRVKTQAFGEDIESVTELPVRPISPYVTESVSGFVEGGKSVTHDIADVYLPYGRRAYLVLSPFPVANFAKQVKHLVGYPHGCIEQTTSKAFPQIYLRDIALLLDPSILERGSPTYFVNEAITKISSMQMHDGAFSYWPGGSHSNSWSTVYATHFLVEAKKAGYAVPEATLRAALGAVSRIARSKATTDYYYRTNNRTLVKRIADKSAIYGLYVLASAGQPKLSVMNFYRTAKSLLTRDTQYLLAGAFALSADRTSYVELMPDRFGTEEAKRTSGRYFDSPIRANALILNILLETDANNPNIARYMDYLSTAYRRRYWHSTQDNAFTLLAFGKAARLATGEEMQGTVTIGNTQHVYKGDSKKFDVPSFGGNVTVSLEGEGRVYYSLVLEGIRKDGKVRIEDKNMRVRRRFLDRNGSPVKLLDVQQNSLIVVKVTVSADVDALENVAITDLLPGGFEIENPRLTETTQYNFIRKADKPVYVDIRDDRINFYTNFARNDQEQTFYYLVRAVTRGEFHYAPIVAETMYDGNYYSASGLESVVVGE